MFISPQVWLETTLLVTSNISPVACANNGKQKTFCVSWFSGDSRSINKKLQGKFLSSNITRNHNTSIWYSANWHIGIPFHTPVIDLFAWKFARSLVLACSVAPFSDRQVPGSCHHMLLLCFNSNHLFIPLQTSPNHFATDILLVEEVLHQMIYIQLYIINYTYLKPYCILCFNCSILQKNSCFPAIFPNHQPPVFFHRRFASQAEITRLQLMSAVDPKWRQKRSHVFFCKRNCGPKIHGNTTVWYLEKELQLYSRESGGI